MRLWPRRRRGPDAYDLEYRERRDRRDRYADQNNLGYWLGEEASERRQGLLKTLAELSNATPGAELEVNAALDEIERLGLSLAEVVLALREVGRGEFAFLAVARALEGTAFWHHVDGWDGWSGWGVDKKWPHHQAEVADYIASSSQRLEEWAKANVPADGQQVFSGLAARYREQSQAIVAAYNGLLGLETDLNEALRKDRIIKAAQALTPETGLTDPQQALSQVGEAQLTAAAISQGLDEAYQLAEAQLERPVLGELEVPTPAVAPLAVEPGLSV